MVIMINVMLWTNSNAGFDKILSALVLNSLTVPRSSVTITPS